MRLSNRTEFGARLQFILAVLAAVAVSLLCVSAAFGESLNKKRQSLQPELRVCSQNLDNFGVTRKNRKAVKRGKKTRREKQNYLIQRFFVARCDVIAVQELGGASEISAKKNLDNLAGQLFSRTKRHFSSYVGHTLDHYIRNGFLVADDVGKVVSQQNFSEVNLPKLQPLGPSRRFARGPTLLVIRVNGKGEAPSRNVVIITMHLKSRAGAWKDPTGTGFEALRIEMAEGLRKLALDNIAKFTPEAVLVILGDKNSDTAYGAAKVLSGRLHIKDFFPPVNCRLTKSLFARCPEKVSRKVELQGLIEKVKGIKNLGSYRYRDKQYLIDEILMRPKDLWMVQLGKGEMVAGLTGRYGKGSDHKLIWAELNW